MHATALLGLCAILDANRDKWRGTVIALFQPAEENGSGALAMLDDGLVGRIPHPDVFLAQHIIPGPAGTVFSKEGPTLAGSDSIEIIVHGRSAHGSMPHTAIDPTYVAAMIVVRLQGIVGREIPPSEFAVASVGTLEAGHSNNIIPGEARIVVNCRTYDESVRERLNAAIERVVRAECAASGVTAEPTIRYFAHAPITKNSAEVFARVRPEFDAVFGANSQDAREWTASEDFTNIPRAYGDAGRDSSLYWFVGCTPVDQWEAAAAAGTLERTIPVNHSGEFLPDFSPTVRACTIAAASAVFAYVGTEGS